MTVSNNKTTYLISSQVPEFVRQDHISFVTFLEEYYKFLAQEGEMEYVAKNFNNYLNIDIIKEHIEDQHSNPADFNDYHAFLQKMYDNFIKLIPAKVLADRSLILKHAKDFYRARGSEKSVRFLIRILLGKELDEDFGFYYPKRDVLRASDGKWLVEKSIRIKDVAVNNASNSTAYTNFVNKTVRGVTSNATAIVETVDVYYENGQLITELKLSGSYKSFSDGEKVFCFYTEDGSDKYLSANLFSGIITTVSLANGGSGYVEGAYVPLEGGGGTGGQVQIASVTKGTISGIGVIFGDAGFRVDDSVLISGGGGSGANAKVLTVNTDETYHPNSYNIISSTIASEANTTLGNLYANLSGTNANSWIINGMSTWAFSNCGPIESCLLISTGSNYSSLPNVYGQGNTVIKSLGILGRMKIVDGGLNYAVGNILQFVNPPGAFGFGANATVTEVAANGMITKVKFVSSADNITGGAGYAGVGSVSGYDSILHPIVNVSSATGNGANIIVTSLLGYPGEKSLIASTGTIGKILNLKIVSGGSGYTTPPTLNLANMSSGSGGIATATIATGAYTYPGRYINDDGHLSSYNFLEDRDYYQNYSYVVRVNASLKDYRKVLKDLTHPAGTRMFGQYLIPRDDVNLNVDSQTFITNTKFYLSTYQVNTSDVLLNGFYNVKTLSASYQPEIRSNTSSTDGRYSVRSNLSATYTSGSSVINVIRASHGISKNDNVFLQFSESYANIINGYYTVTSASRDLFTVTVKNGNTSFVVLPTNTSNLTASTGIGDSNNYVTLSQLTPNSNISIGVGDSVNVGGNLVSVVFTNSISNQIIVSPGLPGNIVSNTVFVNKAPFNASGNVKIFDPSISLFVSTSLVAGDRAYVKFNSSDTTLANDSYTILSANSTLLKVRHRDIVNAASFSGNVSIYTRTTTVTSNNHQLSENENVFITFYTGDTGNATNGIYVATGVTQNTFNITTGNSVTDSGLAILKTANIVMNVASHGFDGNDSVYIWFTSGDTANLDNGYHTVTVLNDNEFSMIHNTIPSSNGNLTVYRNFMNVTITRSGHGFTLGDDVAIQFETGDLANISNGIYFVNNVVDTDVYRIKHDAITITGNITNLLANTTGTAYVSVV